MEQFEEEEKEALHYKASSFLSATFCVHETSAKSWNISKPMLEECPRGSEDKQNWQDVSTAQHTVAVIKGQHTDMLAAGWKILNHEPNF